jgi:ATP-dependent Clp protease adaptor protein ClpS
MSEILMSKTKTETVVRNRIEPKLNIQEPPQYRVIYINDEVTTQGFVVETLVLIFSYPHIEAEELTMKIHLDGSAVVATLPYEMAEQKGVEVTLLARNNGFPLIVKLEPEA